MKWPLLRYNHPMPGQKRNKFLIVGIARNIARTFSEDYSRIDAAIRAFGATSWFIVESDSNDKSNQFLNTFQSTKTNFNFTSLGDLGAKFPSRTVRLAEARNRYLKHLEEYNKIEKFDFVVICDFNNLNDKINSNSIQSCWDNEDWDVCTANQSGRYYDIWALRHPLWSANDCWQAHAFYRKYLKNPELALYVSLHSRMIKIPTDSPWIEVDSAFGGLAIYKTKTLLGLSHSGQDHAGNQVCEHVALNRQIRDRGYKIFVNPNLINTSVTDHSRFANLFFKMYRISKYPFKWLRNERNL
jgi:hypothetical protein